MIEIHTTFHNLLRYWLNQVWWNCSNGSFKAKWFTKLTPIHLLHKFQTAFTIRQDIRRWEVVSCLLPLKAHIESTRWTNILIKFCFIEILSCNALQAKQCVEGGIDRPHITLYISLKVPRVRVERISYAIFKKYLKVCGYLQICLISVFDLPAQTWIHLLGASPIQINLLSTWGPMSKCTATILVLSFTLLTQVVSMSWIILVIAHMESHHSLVSFNGKMHLTTLICVCQKKVEAANSAIGL